MVDERGNIVMEKKYQNRSGSVPPKSGNGSADSKKSENGNYNKSQKFNKELTNRRYRPDFSGNVGRKAAPQKSRISADKRPRTRGTYYEKQKEEVALGNQVELGSAYKPGSKKISLNHLLNFTIAPRDGDAYGGWSGGYGSWNGPRKHRFTSRAKYNKEQFLQANCQFVVESGPDYSIHLTDPDILVDWQHIEQLRILSSEAPSCPICLYPPTAAKITRCGHIYCWSCILHYLALGEHKWRKCPICYDAIHIEHLRSVETLPACRFNIGDEITMRLMSRSRGSAMIKPHAATALWTEQIPKLQGISDSPFAKLIIGLPEQVDELIIQPERRILEQQLKECEPSEICFIEAALALLQERKDNLKGLPSIQNPHVNELPIQTEPLHEIEPPATAAKVLPGKGINGQSIIQYTSAFSDDDEPEDSDSTASTVPSEYALPMSHSCESLQSLPPMSPCSESLQNLVLDDDDDERDSESPPEGTISQDEALNQLELPVQCDSPDDSAMLQGAHHNPLPSNTPADNYYFLQAADGQHIYIHSLNARCLMAEYGGLQNCPETVTATIVDIESIFMTQELRRRLRYLSHLPLRCEFKVVEVVLKPPIVSREILTMFEGDIERRYHQRQKKLRDEKRHTRKVQEVENKMLGIYPAMSISLSSHRQFPQHLSSFAPGEILTRSNNPSPASTLSEDSSSIGPHSPGLNVYATEFAPGSPEKFECVADDSSQNSTMSFAKMLKEGKSRPVLQPTPVRGLTLSKSVESDSSDVEDRPLVPEYQASFGDAFQQALDKYSTEKDVVLGVGTATKGKKKKKQRKLLFSTSMSMGK